MPLWAGQTLTDFRIVGVGIHIKTGVNVWRIPFGFQLVPAGIMAFGLFTIKVRFPPKLPYFEMHLTHQISRNPHDGSPPLGGTVKLLRTLLTYGKNRSIRKL